MEPLRLASVAIYSLSFFEVHMSSNTIRLSGEYYTIIRDGGLIRDGGGYNLITTSIKDEVFLDNQEIRPVCGRGLFKTKKQAVEMAKQVAARRNQIKVAKKTAEFSALLSWAHKEGGA